MAFLQVKKESNLSYIIKKNPTSGMQIKDVKKGYMFGWFKNNTYNIYFRDGVKNSSYKDGEFEYMDETRYNSPMFVIDSINEFFSDNVKKQINEDDEIEEIELKINMIHLRKPEVFTNLQKIFGKEFEVTLLTKQIEGLNYELIFITKKSFHFLLNTILIYCLLLIANSKDYSVFVEEGIIKKYIGCLNNINANFHSRYMFKINFLSQRSKGYNSRKLFKDIKNLLETDTIKLEYGDSYTHRIDAILNKIDIKNEKSIVDIGCGNIVYGDKIMYKGFKGNYYGIDIDEEELKKAYNKKEKYKYENIYLFNNYDSLLKEVQDKDSIIILSEVIEHMEKEEAIELLKYIKDKIKFKKILITTPNKDFNKYYVMNDSLLRHEDHKFELNEIEFKDMIKSIFNKDFGVTFNGIGDNVDNIYSTLFAEVKCN